MKLINLVNIMVKKLLNNRVFNNFSQKSSYKDSILTKAEFKKIKENIESGFINFKDIDWENIEDLKF